MTTQAAQSQPISVVLPVNDTSNITANSNSNPNNDTIIPKDLSNEPQNLNNNLENNTDSKNNNQSNINTQTQNSNQQTDQNNNSQQNNNNTNDILDAEIDGVIYKLDDKGNAINEDGSIFMTKDKMESLLNEDNNIINEVEKINNIIITNENGEPITYDPTPQGIAKRELDIVNYAKSVGQQEGVKSFLESNPELDAMYRYKQQYGTLDGYGKTVDYETLSVDKTNKDQLKQFIIDEQLKKGNTITIAKSFAEFAEKNNQLEELGTSAYNTLKNNQIAERQTQQSNFKKWADSYYGVELDKNGQVKDLKIQGSLYDMIVNKGEFNNLKIPKDGIVIKNNDGTTSKLSGKDLFEFAAYAEQDGQTKLDKVISSYFSKAENKLTIGMYILKGGDLSELANAAVNRNQINRIKLSTQNNKSNSKQVNPNNTSTKGNIIIPVQ